MNWLREYARRHFERLNDLIHGRGEVPDDEPDFLEINERWADAMEIDREEEPEE